MLGIRKKKGKKRKVDNRMRAFGDTDLETGVIRINKKKNKKAGKGELIDTIVHEEMHLAHPKMHEKTIKRKTKAKVKKLSNKRKRRLYNRYN